MPIRFECSGLRQLLRNFCSARGGNVAVTFALVTIPLFGGVGAALDYSRASAIRTSMQAALDATALSLGKQYSTLMGDQLKTKAVEIFTSEFKSRDAHNTTITAANNPSGNTIQVNASASIDTTLLGIVGIHTISIAASSTATYAVSGLLRVALVLDNTGSMADSGKMTALKTAANNLVAKLKSAAVNNGDVYVSIIPFATDVNAGSSNYTANWIDWTDWNNNNGSCSKDSWWKQYNTKSACSWAGGYWTPDSHGTWNGCFTDRGNSSGPSSANYDTNVASPNTSISASLFLAQQETNCPVALLAQTYNWSAMTNLINSMTPAGTTNQAIGLVWGWLSLTQGSILNPPAKTAGYTYADHIILLTDGLNTKDRWYSDASSIDARQKLTCANIKAAGITVWTIQVNTGGDPTSTLLQQCASDSSKFYLLTSASQIITTFDEISFKIIKLHLAK